MNQLEARLRELLSRALFIPKEQHAEILASDPLKQREILDILEKMDAHQTKVFAKALDEKPWLLDEAAQKIEANRAQKPDSNQ